MKIINAVELLSQLYPNNEWWSFYEFEMEKAVREWCRSNNAYWYRQNGLESFDFATAQKWAIKFGRESMVVSLF